MQYPDVLPSIYFESQFEMSSQKLVLLKSKDNFISFEDFQKILWAVARDCLNASPTDEPVTRLACVLHIIDM